MKVLLAETAGFCKGVRLAMNKVLKHSEQTSQTIYTDGPLIHNPQTIEILKRRGVKVMSDQDRPQPNETVFIRTHGISPQRRKEIQSYGVAVCDATCPDVAKIQGLIRRHRRAGYLVVIVGDRNHAEVVGLAGYAGDQGHVIITTEEIAKLPDAEKVCVVAQSTLEKSVYSRVAAGIKKRYNNVEVLDTICPSTYRRQDEIRQLSKAADAVVVVGGRNSANTSHLVQISKGNGKPTFHVETAEELDASSLRHYHTVAVTAGASTPNWILMQVVDRLKEIEPEGASPVFRLVKQTGRFVVKSNIFVAFGSAMLCFANARLMGISLGWLPYAVAFCYILSVHLMSHFTHQGVFQLAKSPLGAYRGSENRLYFWLAVVSAAIALLLAVSQGAGSLLIMTLLLFLGLLYHIDIPYLSLPVGGKKLSLRLIPASKDLFMGLGWAFVTVFFPLQLKGLSFITPALFVTFTATFLLVTIRSLFFDVRDIQGDQIVGRETLPTIIGTKGTMILMISLTSLYVLVISLGVALDWLTGFGKLILLIAAYVCFYIYLYHRRIIRRETPVEVLGNTQFILAGVLAFLYG
jgi:(E)-4-hydroxy-3-methyl-but-2-enyl pyrophosphate reductase